MSDDLVYDLEGMDLDDIRDRPSKAAALMESAAAEITRLRAACDDYFKTISLSQMRHGRILVGLERRNARQRRALAKLYQRRHDKNAALTTARREGMENAAKIAEGEAYEAYEGRYRTWPWWENKDGSQGNMSNENYLVKHCDKIAAAIRAAAKERKS